jgi:hypothetical protein
LPGHETQEQLRLHRWCQWLSHYYWGGVYAGEVASMTITRLRCRHFCCARCSSPTS